MSTHDDPETEKIRKRDDVDADHQSDPSLDDQDEGVDWSSEGGATPPVDPDATPDDDR